MLKVVDNELYFYDVIGPSYWGYIGADEVVAELAKLKGQKVIARINSPGGGVDEGIAIFNALRRHDGGVEVVIDAMAASIASVIAMAGQKVTMSVGSRMMIHDPWTIIAGNAAALRKEADVLDVYRDSIIETYRTRSKKEKQAIIDMMAAETWMSAENAVENGFADVIEGVAVEQPAVPKDLFSHVPKDVKSNATMGQRRRDAAAILMRVTKARLGI